MPEVYGPEFYAYHAPGSYRSAMIVAEILRRLIPIESVLDIGCGVGTWLKAFKEVGATRVEGYDGHYIDSRQLIIGKEEFRAM